MMFDKLPSLLRRFAVDDEAVVAVEFAIVAPVMVAILVAIVQIGGHIIERSAAERAATELLHIATQYDNTGPNGNEETAFERSFEAMARVRNQDNYRVYITHFERDTGIADEKWTVTLGNWTKDSVLESGGSLASTNAAALIPNEGDAIVTVEVYRRNPRFDLSYLLDGSSSTTIETARYGLTR